MQKSMREREEMIRERLQKVEKPLVVFHGDNCQDGMTALWVCMQAWPDAEPYEANYGDPVVLDKMRERDVVLVDFSWKRPELIDAAGVVRSITVVDHHKTAKKELEGLEWCFFDEERSGAGIMWDLLHPGWDRAWIIDYTEDADLYRYDLPASKEVRMARLLDPVSLDSVERAYRRGFAQTAADGHIALKYQRRLIEQFYDTRGTVLVDGIQVPGVVCAARMLRSDLGHRLCQGHKFGVVIEPRKDNGDLVLHLFSDENGRDVGALAHRHDGGGHKHAAGFTIKGGALRKHNVSLYFMPSFLERLCHS